MFWFLKKKRNDAQSVARRSGNAQESIAPAAEAASLDPATAELEAEILARRRRRATANKTRLMGFDTSDGRVVDLFDDATEAEPSNQFKFPVAIVMIVKGPGFGECFAIHSGMSQIGRGEDQAIQVDFGDQAISRSNHAAIVYDKKEHTFLLGHGGKSNIVRLNGHPVVSTSALADGDEIEIGETTLRFRAICSPEFNWEDMEQNEGTDDDDVEIA